MDNNSSSGNYTMYYVFGAALVLAGAGFIYYKYGMVDSGTPGTPGATDTPAPDKSAPAPTKVSGATDYTGLANGKSLFPKMPETAHGLNLGQDVTVRAGATVTRLDQALSEKGTTKLTADTALGKIWKHDVNATIRAKDSFSYPFYRVKYDDINQKGSVVDKAVGEAKSVATGAYDWIKGKLSAEGDGYIGADGFGEL